MNVLIVDDDRFVVAALKKGIRWERLGFTEIYTAYNFEQARISITDHRIDLLISDIDMPHGSGLDLLTWMRSRRDDTPCIFLTNYADFSYAQQAIDLKCFHYFLKPVDYEKLTGIIRKAVAEVSHKYSQESRRYLSFWRNIMFSSRYPTDAESPYNAEALLYPVCIQLYPYYLRSDLTLQSHFVQGVCSAGNGTGAGNGAGNGNGTGNCNGAGTDVDHASTSGLIQDCVSYVRPIFESVVPGMENDGSILTSGLPGTDRCVAVIAGYEDSPERLRTALEEFLDTFQHQTHCPANVYLGNAVHDRDVPAEMEKLTNLLRNDLGDSGHVCVAGSSPAPQQSFAPRQSPAPRQSQSSATLQSSASLQVSASLQPSASQQSSAPQEALSADISKIENFLSEDRFDLLSDYCHDYLDTLQQSGSLNALSMRNFQIDVVQQIYAHLGKRGILAKRLFYGEPYHTIAACADRRAQDLEMYFHYIFSIAEKNLAGMGSAKGVADVIRDYVDAHYADDIGRDSLSDILYFDPDYASRLFKKETGISFMNYVIQRRLSEAKRLLRTTEYPISKIALLVGYDNYSYFTRLFKKEIGVTPVEYRMQ